MQNSVKPLVAGVFLLIWLICPAAINAASAPQPVALDLEEEWRIQFHVICDMKQGRMPLGDRPYDDNLLILRSDRHPVDVVLRRTEMLLEDLAARPDFPLNAEELRGKLAQLKDQANSLPEWAIKAPALESGGRIGKDQRDTATQPQKAGEVDLGPYEATFTAACELNRQIALANPLFDMERLVFVKRYPPRVGHMCDQWYGMAQTVGGGLFVVDNPGSDEATIRNLTEGAKVQEGGPLTGQELDPGVFVTPEVTYDGKSIYFAYSGLRESFADRWEAQYRKYEETEDSQFKLGASGGRGVYEIGEYVRTENDAFHLMRINADGSNLVQITSGAEEDFSPCMLPNGRIAFVSTRRGGEGRCHPRPAPTYVLHTMLPDGSDIQPLSYHEINEWSPRVNNEGNIVYSRWDYVDRHTSDGQHPWIIRQDGGNSRALYGNYENVFQGKVQEELRAVPSSPFYVGVLHSHHGSAYGNLVMYDSRQPDTEPQPGVTTLTPEIGSSSPGRYASPYPLDDTHFLCVWSPDAHDLSLNTAKWFNPTTPHGIYLIDKFGNKTLLYRDEEISCMHPIPLEAREKEPVQPHTLAHAYPPGVESDPDRDPATATVSIMDVYQSTLPWPEDREIAALRIVQVFPKTTPKRGNPTIGYFNEMNARGVLGTVPVEKDGSAHFTMPTEVPVYFQALDTEGLAIQSMRSSMYAMPGETISCIGCHEPRDSAAPNRASTPLALMRPPSRIEPGPEGSWPLNFMHIMQPVLDARCVQCHDGSTENKKRIDLTGGKKAFKNLKPYAWCLSGKGEVITRPKGQEEETSPVRSIPGKVGTTESLLWQILQKEPHKSEVKLTREDLKRITTWLDCMSPFYGAYEDLRAQEQGELVNPSLQ